MTRPLRIDFPDALYHVTSRGDRREPIFVDDADRLVFLDVQPKFDGSAPVSAAAPDRNLGRSTTCSDSAVVFAERL